MNLFKEQNKISTNQSVDLNKIDFLLSDMIDEQGCVDHRGYYVTAQEDKQYYDAMNKVLWENELRSKKTQVKFI